MEPYGEEDLGNIVLSFSQAMQRRPRKRVKMSWQQPIQDRMERQTLKTLLSNGINTSNYFSLDFMAEKSFSHQIVTSANYMPHSGSSLLCPVPRARVCAMLFLFLQEEWNLLLDLYCFWGTWSALKSCLDHIGKSQELRIVLSFLCLPWFSVRFQSQTSKKGGLHSLPPHPLLPTPPHSLPSGFCSLLH